MIIRTYPLKHDINVSKQEKIYEVLKHYRKLATKISDVQWNLFFSSRVQQKFNKDLDIKELKTRLSARYKQTCQYQVTGILQSYMENRKEDFKRIVYNSSLKEEERIKLLYINKHNKWFCEEVKMKGLPIEKEIIKLSRVIMKRLLKKNRKPRMNNINMALDNKVIKIEKKHNNKAKKFDYWLKFSTLEKGSPVMLPLISNHYFEEKEGKLKNFVQMNFNNGLNICLMKEHEQIKYVPKNDKISIDIGLRNLFALNTGELYGKNFIDKLKRFDKVISKLVSNKQRQNLDIKSKKYIILRNRLRNYVKNEMNRLINKIISLYKPEEIIIERLNFKNTNLSKVMNRLLSGFSKSIIVKKFQSLEELYGIKVTEVNPAYTSQTCSNCGYVDKNNRRDRDHFECKFCGLKIHSDVNGAREIFTRSSGELGNIYLKKSVILNKLVKDFIKRHSVNRCTTCLLPENPYFDKALAQQDAFI
jgi:putative transposase